MLNSQENLPRELNDRAIAVAQMLNRTEVAVARRHNATRSIIVDAIRKIKAPVITERSQNEAGFVKDPVTSMNAEETELKLRVETL